MMGHAFCITTVNAIEKASTHQESLAERFLLLRFDLEMLITNGVASYWVCYLQM